MKRFTKARLATAGALATAVATAWLPIPAAGGDSSLKAHLIDTSGNVIGKAKLAFGRDKSRVRVDLQLPASMAGFHGFHIHSTGQCAAPFKSAGGHLGEVPGDLSHRHRNHDGDLPVLLVNGDGTASARFETDRIDVAELSDSDGSAFIVHALPDNYANIPSRYNNPNPIPVYPNSTTDEVTLQTGDAGDRIACGIIR